MISVEKLIGLTHSYNPRSDEKLIRHAFDYAKKMHKGQLRRSGEPYFMHPYAVAMQLAEQHMDDATVITALCMIQLKIQNPHFLTSRNNLTMR